MRRNRNCKEVKMKMMKSTRALIVIGLALGVALGAAVDARAAGT